ncbi:MAG: peptidylprolyl isomerase [Chloroflexota bacterium]|nr:peptidylprolyl isomerase [Chloroflexota bacterium]
MNNEVQNNMVVSLDYTARLKDGQSVDSSTGKTPLQYLHGHQNIIPGLEEALTGMKVGESHLNIIVPPEKAYGARAKATEWLPRDLFPSDGETQPGMAFVAEDKSGETYPMFIKEVKPDSVLVDYNHPLAGETLHFEVTVVDVRPATPEELAHGHVHNGDG